MNKIKLTDPKGLDEQPKTTAVLQAAVTVERFKAEGLVFRSLDIVKGIQKSVKGDGYDRNYLKQVMLINFMTKGEVFLEYITMRQEMRVEKAKQKAEEANKNSESNTAA